MVTSISSLYPTIALQPAKEEPCTISRVVKPILITLGTLFALGAVLLAVTVNPLFALGLIPAGILIGAGLFCDEEKKKVNTPDPANPVKKEKAPVKSAKQAGMGLENASNNCWANSVAKFISHIPVLSNAIPSKFKALNDFDTQYSMQKNQKGVLNFDSQRIRLEVSNAAGRDASGNKLISDSQQRQEDAGEALSFIFKTSDAFHLTTVSVDGHANQPFKDLIEKHYFNMHKFQKFNVPPKDLFIQLNRFRTNGKIKDSINISFEYLLPSKYVNSNKVGHYICDAFIEHRGSSMNAGHYVAYIKENGIWKCHNDKSVTVVSESEALKALKKSYIIHYKLQ